jgi:nucleoredoxin
MKLADGGRQENWFGKLRGAGKLPRMKIRRLFLPAGAALVLAVAARAAGLPLETTVTQPTKFEILRNGQVSGSVGLAKGAQLEVIALDGAQVQVRYRSLTGRVPAAHTELAALAAAMSAVTAAPAAAPAPDAAKVASTPVPAARTEAAAAAPSVMERRLQGKLVRLQGGSLRPLEATRLSGVKFYALYYSASWCGPCRQFTPELVAAYGQLRAEYPEFEVVFVSADNSAGDMRKYMNDDKMAWPALRYELARTTPDIRRYAGDGIPCLVLVDANGKVLSDTYRGGEYMGPQVVLEDAQNFLQQYRRKNLRPGT